MKNHVCQCKSIKNALIELYIEVKVRNEISLKEVTPETIAVEKEKLKYVDSLDLVEYLRSSIEILLSLNCCDTSQIQETTSRKLDVD